MHDLIRKSEPCSHEMRQGPVGCIMGQVIPGRHMIVSYLSRFHIAAILTLYITNQAQQKCDFFNEREYATRRIQQLSAWLDS